MRFEESGVLEPTVVALGGLLQEAFRAHQAGDFPLAEEKYYAVLEAVPNHPDALHLLGLICKARGDLGTAKKLIGHAIAVRPDMAAQHYNLGNVLVGEGDVCGAADAYRAAVACQPDYAEAWYALGNQLRELGELTEAAAAFTQAVMLRPDYYEARHNLANVLRESGEVIRSVKELQQVLQQVPDLAEAHYNLALSLFSLNRYAEGWSHYEWRWKAKGFTSPARTFSQPVWDGSPLMHGTLFVYAEQGLGDTLQFIRYLRLVRPLVGQLVVEVPPPLVRVLQAFRDVAVIVPQGGVLPPFDRQIALMSLPYRLGRVEAGAAYLKAEPARVQRWATHLADGSRGLRVGINWQGNPLAKIDKGRSFPLRVLEPLMQIPGVRLISLQKNAGVEQLADFPQVGTLGADYDAGPDAFLDAAAVVENLDLVITSDTALAHLAGALGKPTWVLLKRVPDWRWGMVGTTCRWYPGARLFRQQQDQDWSHPIASLTESLQSLALSQGSR